MSRIKRVFKSSKGTEIPLLDLKGKEYLQVAHRLILLVEDNSNYSVSTDFLVLNENEAVVRAEVKILNEAGAVVKSATATKKETQSGFADFVEKAETGAIGRALAIIGIGTQFCTQDMDEGDRLADAPLDNVKETNQKVVKENTDARPKRFTRRQSTAASI